MKIKAGDKVRLFGERASALSELSNVVDWHVLQEARPKTNKHGEDQKLIRDPIAVVTEVYIDGSCQVDVGCHRMFFRREEIRTL